MKTANIYTTTDSFDFSRNNVMKLDNGYAVARDAAVPLKGKKIDDAVNIRMPETVDIKRLFTAAFGVSFVPFDVNGYNATHIEASPKDTFEVFFDTSKLKICFNDALVDIIPIELFVSAGFVYTRMCKWKCKNRLERHYITVSDFYTAMADLFSILWDSLAVPKVEPAKPMKKTRRRATKKSDEAVMAV